MCNMIAINKEVMDYMAIFGVDKFAYLVKMVFFRNKLTVVGKLSLVP